MSRWCEQVCNTIILLNCLSLIETDQISENLIDLIVETLPSSEDESDENNQVLNILLISLLDLLEALNDSNDSMQIELFINSELCVKLQEIAECYEHEEIIENSKNILQFIQQFINE